MRTAIRYLFSALLLLCANSSYSANVWYSSEMGSGTVFATPDEAGQAGIAYKSANATGTGANGEPETYSFCYIQVSGGAYKVFASGNPHQGFPFGCTAISWAYPVVAACPSGFEDDGSGQCVELPSCPEHQIQTTENGQNICINKCDVVDINGNPRVASFSFVLGTSPPTVVDDGLGCEYSRQSVESCTLNTETDIATCYYSYAETGNYVGVAGSTDSTNEDPVPPQVDVDTTNDSVTENVDVSPTVTNPDGSTTDVVTESKVVTSGGGSKIWDDDDYIYVQNSTGLVSQYDKTVTSVTNPDGSVTEVTSIAGTTATPNVTNNVINKNTGSGSSASTSSTIINNNSTTTNIYNSNGGLVSSETSSTGSGTGTGTGDETVEGNCGAPNQPPCEIVLAGEDNLTDPSLVGSDSGFSSTRDENISDLQSGGTEDTGELFVINNGFKTSFSSVLGSGSCNPSFGTYTLFDSTFEPFKTFCPMYDTNIRPAFKWLLYMFTLIGLYSIYLRTMRES